MRFSKVLESKPAALAIGLGSIALVTLFYWLARGEYDLAIFDLAPIGICTWALGLPAGAGLSFLAAAALLIVDVHFGLQRFSRPTIPFWNNWMRLAVFALVANLVSRLSDSINREGELSDFKSKMLSLVTHEFNHALTVVGVALSLLEQRAEKAGDDTGRLFLQSIQKQHTMLRQLVSNYLNYNRMQQGRFTLTYKPTSALAIVEECVKLMEPLSRQLGVAVAMDFPSDAPPLRADPDALSLVVSNLVGNAVKFTPKGGQVKITLKAPKRAAGRLRLSIEDTGPGIGEQDQEKIRRGVYDIKPADLTRPQSFGLGLRLVEEILRKHETELRIQSWPGEGSTFSFELPVWEDQTPSSSPSPASAPVN